MTVDTPFSGPGVEGRPLPQYTVEDIPALLAVIDDLMRELQGISENYKHRWSEALRHLLIEIKRAVDAAKQEDKDGLMPERRAAFEKRYRTILDEGEEETKTSGVPEK